ncbi:MAG: SDR family NAD(P)-dependent oxidoreductase [Bacteroidales bacterium]|jgi:NADP-dependent 3-hydroxy acid dehydrogenase YdfG|nr:SDR family NAD(P)-dependent oxidoreductase [Bacteroidales bacterium]
MKRVMITGANSGFGRALAFKLLETGNYFLIVTARDTSKLQALITSLPQNTRVHGVVLDVRDFESCKKAIEQIPENFRPIDVLVNNAGLALETRPLHEGDINDWDIMIDTNIKGVLHLTRLIAPDMVARREGHIINIGSIAGHEVYAGGNVYCATKHAVKALSQATRVDFLDYGIRVTEISPGAAETNFSITRFHGDKARADKVYEGYAPLTAEDVAETILFAMTRPPHVCINEIIMTCTAQFNGRIVREK